MNIEKIIKDLQEQYGIECRELLENIDKERIALKCVSLRNRDNIAPGNVFTTCMGITITLCYIVHQTDNERITIPLTNEMLEKSGVDLEELFDLAVNNSIRTNPPVICNTDEFFKSMGLTTDLEEYGELSKYKKDVYIIEGKFKGAAVALFDKATLKKLQEIVDDDVIFVPESEDCIIAVGNNSSIGSLFIQSVVAVQLQNEQHETRLSPYIYLYEKDSGQIRYGSIDDYV